MVLNVLYIIGLTPSSASPLLQPALQVPPTAFGSFSPFQLPETDFTQSVKNLHHILKSAEKTCITSKN